MVRSYPPNLYKIIPRPLLCPCLYRTMIDGTVKFHQEAKAGSWRFARLIHSFLFVHSTAPADGHAGRAPLREEHVAREGLLRRGLSKMTCGERSMFDASRFAMLRDLQ